jgi:hypothetical protein
MSTPRIKDSGERRQFSTGSRRDLSVNKGRTDLLFFGVPFALKCVARHYEEGAVKYGDHNWMRGQPLSQYFRSAQNHLLAFSEGETTEPHIISAIWNLLCLVETYFLIKVGRLPAELNDLIVPVVLYEDAVGDGTCEYDRIIPTDEVKTWPQAQK